MPKRKPRMKPHTAQTAASISPTAQLIRLFRAAIISVAVGILLLLLLCIILLGTDDPGAYAAAAASLVPLPVSVLCGVLAARKSSLGGLPSGLLGGGLLCLLLFALGALLPTGSADASAQLLSPLLRAGLCILLSALGGYAVTHRKPRARRHHP